MLMCVAVQLQKRYCYREEAAGLSVCPCLQVSRPLSRRKGLEVGNIQHYSCGMLYDPAVITVLYRGQIVLSGFQVEELKQTVMKEVRMDLMIAV